MPIVDLSLVSRQAQEWRRRSSLCFSAFSWIWIGGTISCTGRSHDQAIYVAAFWHEVLPHVDAVNQWLDALGDDVGTWPEAGVHFLYLLKAHGEAYQPTAEEQQAFEARRLAWEHDRRRKEAVDQALEAFRQRDYPTVMSLLAPFETELEAVPAAKLAFARRKLAPAGG